MWIDADAKQHMMVNTDMIDTIYVQHKGHGHYAVICTIGDRDILLKDRLGSESDAEAWMRALEAKMD